MTDALELTLVNTHIRLAGYTRSMEDMCSIVEHIMEEDYDNVLVVFNFGAGLCSHKPFLDFELHLPKDQIRNCWANAPIYNVAHKVVTSIGVEFVSF